MQNLAYDIHTPAPLRSLSGQSSAASAGEMRGLVGMDAVLRNAVGGGSFEPLALVGRRVR